MNHFESRLLLALIVGLRVDKAASYRRMSILTAHDDIRIGSKRNEHAQPTNGFSPKGENRHAPLQSQRIIKSFSSSVSSLLLKYNKFPPNTGFGGQPHLKRLSANTFKLLRLDHHQVESWAVTRPGSSRHRSTISCRPMATTAFFFRAGLLPRKTSCHF